MKLIPLYTEKTMNLAKNGKFTFLVSKTATKEAIKKELLKVFGVHVTDIKTVTVAGEKKRNYKGHKVTIKPKKKAIVSLAQGEKMGLFEEEKKK